MRTPCQWTSKAPLLPLPLLLRLLLRLPPRQSVVVGVRRATARSPVVELATLFRKGFCALLLRTATDRSSP